MRKPCSSPRTRSRPPSSSAAANSCSFSCRVKGQLAGFWSIWVNGNWRVTFRFTEQDIELVDYQDCH
nr:type II toxin-antitoxin system RelE/ParE family toxin [Gryllotalpicola protaetiae]